MRHRMYLTCLGLLLALVSACSEDTAAKSCQVGNLVYADGDQWSPKCVSCFCSDGEAGCTDDSGCPTATRWADSCAPSGACTEGPAAGDTACCAAGEWFNGFMCLCGEHSYRCGDDQVCGTGEVGTCGARCVDL